MKKICMVTTSELTHDTRILNEARTLAKFYDLTVLAKRYPGKNLGPYPFTVKLIPCHQFKVFRWSILSSFWSLIKAAFRESPDIYHAHDLDGLVCAFPAAYLKRKTLIYDSHELWSDTYPFSNLKGIQWLLPMLEKLLMWRVNGGITVNSSLANILRLKYRKNFISLYNVTAKEKLSKATLKLKKQFSGKKIILHLGAADEGRGMEQMIEAAKLLPRNFVLVFIGGGKTENELITMIKKENLENKVYFFPALPPLQIVPTIKEADIALALTQPISKSYYYSLPNKIFQYIAANVPILGSNLPEFKKVIIKKGIGETVDPAKTKMIAEKIIGMTKISSQKKYRRRLEGLAKNKYNWGVEGQKLLNFYEKI